MRSSLSCALLLCGVLCAAAPAKAQSQGFQLNRYEPTSAGEWSFWVDHPWYNALRPFAAGITLNYGHNPLVLGVPSADGSTFNTQSALLAHQLIGHLDLAGSIANRVQISFSLPFTLLESGDETTAAQFGVRLVSSAAVGDPRFGAMFRIAGDHYRSPIALSLGAQVWIPLNNRQFPAQTGESGFRFLPKLVLGGLSHHVLWSFAGGFYYRPDATLGSLPPNSGNSVGAEVQLGAAIAYADFERRFSVGPEAVLHTDALDGNAFKVQHTNLEVLLGFHYNIARVVELGVAGGIGALRGPGTPDARALLRIAYAPMPDERPKDRDHDGILDREDACPDEPGVRTSDPATHGCPPPADRDGDGIVDAQDQCPTEPAGAHPDRQRPGCPLGDSDGDGIYDDEDQCASEPAGAHPDAKKPGCPLRDSDGDGVYDDVDQCPSVAAGAHASAVRTGCPDLDVNGDYESTYTVPQNHPCRRSSHVGSPSFRA